MDSLHEVCYNYPVPYIEGNISIRKREVRKVESAVLRAHAGKPDVRGQSVAMSSRVRGRIAEWAHSRPDIRVVIEQCGSTTTIKVRRAAPGVVRSKTPVLLTSVQEHEVTALLNALTREFGLHVEPREVSRPGGYVWKGYTLTLLQ